MDDDKWADYAAVFLRGWDGRIKNFNLFSLKISPSDRLAQVRNFARFSW
jgi:hypothetical protein